MGGGAYPDGVGDLLIAIVVALGIGVLAYGIVSGGRRQRQARRAVFRTFAEGAGLTYVATDDGTAQDFAMDMDGIGRFSSPSLGSLVPTDVASGLIDGHRVVAFRHVSRFDEGNAREWLVAGVEVPTAIASRVAVQFLTPRGSADTSYLEDPIAKEHEVAGARVVLRSPTPDAAGALLQEQRLEALADAASRLPFRPELQVRDRRLAAYPASRNASLDDVDQLTALIRFALEAAKIAGG